MGKFRKNILAVGISFAAAVMLLEFSGYREAVGVSWWGVIGIIPWWVAVPMAFALSAFWLLDS